MPELTIGVFALLVVAGFGAGVVTGLAGASAAAVVTPLLITFSPIPAYTAIAISLITDVFASFFSFLTYRKNGNINIKDGIYLTITACLGAVLGSYLSSGVDTMVLGIIGGVMTLLLGLNFLRKGKKLRLDLSNGVDVEAKKLEAINNSPLAKYNPVVVSSILGFILGILCGFVGAGGGLMILYVLTAVLRYDTKTAVGTSVLIMTFTALTGGLSHFAHMEGVNFVALGLAMSITSIFAVIGAKIAAAFANRTSEDNLLIIVGVTFTVIALSMALRIVTALL